MLSLLKADRSHALEGRAVETDAVDCLDRGAGPWRWLRLIGFLAGDAGLPEELIHNIGVSPFAARFFAEILSRHGQ